LELHFLTAVCVSLKPAVYDLWRHVLMWQLKWANG